MPIVTIKINGKNFDLSCGEGEEAALTKLAQNLDLRLSKLKASNPYASYELLLLMAALSLEEKLSFGAPAEAPGGESEEFSQTLSEIAGYLEKLAKKVKKG